MRFPAIVQQTAAVIHQDRAGPRDINVTAQTIEQAKAAFLLSRADLRADCRLGQTQSFRGAREALQARHLHYRANLCEIHASYYKLLTMDFDQIQAFLRIVEEKSFSRAADKLYRTQPALSKQVRQLETELGQRLLSRQGKQIEPTPAGRIFIEHARKIVDTRTEALEALKRLRDRPRGRLSIGANEATQLYVLPPVFAEFRARFPEVRLSLRRNFTRKLVEHVLANSLDFGVVSLPVDEKDLIVIPLNKDELVVVAPPKHPLTHFRAVTIEQVAQHPVIFPRTGRTRVLFDRVFSSGGVEPKIALELASNE